MRRIGALILGLAAAACGGDVPDEAERPPEPAGEAPDRVRRVPRETATEQPEVAPPAAPRPRIDAESFLRQLKDPASRAQAEALLADLPEAESIALLRRGLALPDDLALEAAKRLEHHHLDSDESARLVALLLPHLFDEADEIDFDELRSALGSSEIGRVLQEMREHETIAGERSLLGALHRQLRAEHLPALVEMALSPDPALAEQAFEEIAIVALYTNRHREDVARIFAGRAEAPDAMETIPEALAVALRAIVADGSLGETRRPMFLAWALRWLRDIEPTGGGDADFLVDLAARACASETLGESERDQVLLYAIVELKPFAAERLEDVDAASPEVATALRVAALARSDDASMVELRELAAHDPLAMALAMELDPFAAPLAFVAGLQARSPEDAYDWVDDVYSRRFLLRLGWDQLPSLGIQPPLDGRLEPALILRLAERFREVRGSHAVAAYLENGVTNRPLAGWEGDVLARIEGPALTARLRELLATGSPFGRAQAGELLAALGDRGSEDALLDAARAGDLPAARLPWIAAWASETGRARIAALLPSLDESAELTTRAVLGGVPRRTARAWISRHLLGTEEHERGPEVGRAVERLRSGDAVGALLGYLDDAPNVELEGVGHVDDPRVVPALRRFAQSREDGRAHWAIGELAIAGDPVGLRQMQEVVRTGRYRWVDDASAEALFVGGGGVLSFWVEEAESNCCRAVPVKRVFEDGLRIPVTEEMGFQAGFGVTLSEWLRWRLGETRWLTPKAGPCRLGAPESVRGLVWSDLLDGYVPAIR